MRILLCMVSVDNLCFHCPFDDMFSKLARTSRYRKLSSPFLPFQMFSSRPFLPSSLPSYTKESDGASPLMHSQVTIFALPVRREEMRR